MLSRTVCESCLKQRAIKITNFASWNSVDVEAWDLDGKVHCSAGQVALVAEQPPVWCPNAFRHAVGIGMTNAK
jgi:hypothetical protein